VPVDLINAEEIDKIIMMGDSLRAKIAAHEEYPCFDDLEKKQHDIRCEFDNHFDAKIQNLAKVISGSTINNNSTEGLSNQNVSGNLVFSDETNTDNILQQADISRISWNDHQEILLPTESNSDKATIS